MKNKHCLWLCALLCLLLAHMCYAKSTHASNQGLAPVETKPLPQRSSVDSSGLNQPLLALPIDDVGQIGNEKSVYQSNSETDSLLSLKTDRHTASQPIPTLGKKSSKPKHKGKLVNLTKVHKKSLLKRIKPKELGFALSVVLLVVLLLLLLGLAVTLAEAITLWAIVLAAVLLVGIGVVWYLLERD